MQCTLVLFCWNWHACFNFLLSSQLEPTHTAISEFCGTTMAYECFGRLLTVYVAGWEDYEKARAYCLIQSISRYSIYMYPSWMGAICMSTVEYYPPTLYLWFSHPLPFFLHRLDTLSSILSSNSSPFLSLSQVGGPCEQGASLLTFLSSLAREGYPSSPPSHLPHPLPQWSWVWLLDNTDPEALANHLPSSPALSAHWTRGWPW